jgi:transcriptional regulator with XRE-family HTH domain
MAKLPIEDWCDAVGIAQVALARRAGITSSVLSDYSRGRRNPTLKSISALAKAIGREPWEFLRGLSPAKGFPPKTSRGRPTSRGFRN